MAYTDTIVRRIASMLQCTGRNYLHDAVEKLVKDTAPSGSGIDTGTKINLEKSSANKLVFEFGFHHMNENGFYDGWTEHTAIVTPSLTSQFDLRITGRNRNDIKDYLHDTFYWWLSDTITTDTCWNDLEKTGYTTDRMKEAQQAQRAAELEHKRNQAAALQLKAEHDVD